MKFLERSHIHSRFDSFISTGRVASSNPNVQNWPREGGVRECIVAKEGKSFIICDYSSAELHTLAQTQRAWFGSSVLGERLNEGKDVHCLVGANLGSKDYQWVVDNRKTDDWAGSLRVIGKTANYSMAGFAGWRKIDYIAKKSGVDLAPIGEVFLAEAGEKEVRKALSYYKFMKGHTYRGDPDTPRNLILRAMECSAGQYAAYLGRKAWLQTWPEQQMFFDAIKNGGDTVTLPISGRTRTSQVAPELANFAFQGAAADGMCDATCLVFDACYFDTASALYGATPLLCIHDELILEIEDDRAENGLLELQRLMLLGFNQYVPDYPVKTEGEIKKIWSK